MRHRGLRECVLCALGLGAYALQLGCHQLLGIDEQPFDGSGAHAAGGHAGGPSDGLGGGGSSLGGAMASGGRSDGGSSGGVGGSGGSQDSEPGCDKGRLDDTGWFGAWPDSATATCVDPGAPNGDSVTCNASTYPGQDGTTGTMQQSFTAQSDGQRDTQTDLTWQTSASDSALSWQDAHSYCKAVGAGFRLPTRVELLSILNYGTSHPALPEGSIFTSGVSGEFWTATCVSNEQGAWVFSLDDGSSIQRPHEDSAFVRCVKGTPLAAPVDDTTLPIHDPLTNLDWEGPVGPPATWAEALAACGGLADGYRLPNIKELQTILADDRSRLLIDNFTMDGSNGYWSSTPIHQQPTRAWAIKQDTLAVIQTPRDQSHEVLCVKP